MSTTLIEVRPAKAADATAVASTHDEAWRSAYQGIIPGAELEKLINRRGPQWWDSAIRKGSRVSVLVFGDKIAGYANYGRNRARSLHFDGEIYELYLRPEFQGLGFGRRLFAAARRDLMQQRLPDMRQIPVDQDDVVLLAPILGAELADEFQSARAAAHDNDLRLLIRHAHFPPRTRIGAEG